MKYFEEHPIVKKAMNEIHDRIPINLIGIHGKLYDPKLFVHPGGTGFIEMCMGCDCSTLFETHHLNKHLADKMLLTLPIVGEYEIQYKYDWNKYANIRSSVFKLFPTRNSREMNFVTKVTLITYVIITFMLHLILLNTIPNFGIPDRIAQKENCNFQIRYSEMYSLTSGKHVFRGGLAKEDP